MASLRETQPTQATPVYAPKPSFWSGAVNVWGLRIPNVVIVILIILVIWLLWSGRCEVKCLTPAMVGGALETSSSPTSSFFDNIHL